VFCVTKLHLTSTHPFTKDPYCDPHEHISLDVSVIPAVMKIIGQNMGGSGA